MGFEEKSTSWSWTEMIHGRFVLFDSYKWIKNNQIILILNSEDSQMIPSVWLLSSSKESIYLQHSQRQFMHDFLVWWLKMNPNNQFTLNLNPNDSCMIPSVWLLQVNPNNQLTWILNLDDSWTVWFVWLFKMDLKNLFTLFLNTD